MSEDRNTNDPTCVVCGKSWTKHPGAERLCRQKRELLDILDRADSALYGCMTLYGLNDLGTLRKEIAELRAKM